MKMREWHKKLSNRSHTPAVWLCCSVGGGLQAYARQSALIVRLFWRKFSDTSVMSMEHISRVQCDHLLSLKLIEA